MTATQDATFLAEKITFLNAYMQLFEIWCFFPYGMLQNLTNEKKRSHVIKIAKNESEKNV